MQNYIFRNLKPMLDHLCPIVRRKYPGQLYVESYLTTTEGNLLSVRRILSRPDNQAWTAELQVSTLRNLLDIPLRIEKIHSWIYPQYYA